MKQIKKEDFITEKKVCSNKLIVDTEAIKSNLIEISKLLTNKTKIMPVIKANAYGLGVKEIIKIIEKLNIDIVAVAIVDEGVNLRRIGYKGEIFILNQPYIEEIPAISENELTIGVSALSFIEGLQKYPDEFKVHIEIGTGMGRTGIHPKRCGELIDKILQYKNIKIEGIYTHFACSDCDEEYTNQQICSFEKALKVANEKLELKYVHACNSAGVIDFSKAHYNLVRPGLMMYGYLPNETLSQKVSLKPCSVLKSKVTFIKEIEKDFYIGYAKSYRTTKRTTVLTIPIGYADGLKRLLSNNGFVVINNVLAPIIGNICMDSFMVDGTNIPNVDVGSDVYIWDNELITLEDVAKRCQTINYEIISSITDRVRRKYR